MFISQAFDKWLTRTNTSSLFKDGQPPAIDDLSAVVDGGLYTLGTRSIPTRVRNLELQARHLLNRREDEFALLIAAEQIRSGVPVSDVEVLPELRVLYDQEGKAIAEFDAVVRAGEVYIVGSMKTYVNGDSDIKSLNKQVHEKLPDCEPFKGHAIRPAFMAEKVEESKVQRILQTCRRMGVQLYRRTGSSIGRVHCRAQMV